MGPIAAGKETPMGKLRPALARLAVFALLAALATGLRQGYELLATGASYKAKVLCSGVFVSRRAADAVLAEDLAAEDLAPLRLIDARVDWAGRAASAGFLGLVRQKAVYRADSGCTLVYAGQDGAAAPADIPPAPADLQAEPDARLDAALDWAFAEPDPGHLRRTRAVVVLRDGKIAAERYAPGFGPATPLPGWSMAKSVVNALVGILAGQGRLDLAAPAPVPEWRGEGDPRRAVTLEHLLRMIGGLEFSEKEGGAFSDVARMLLRGPDAAAYAAAKPLEAAPGTRWAYASGATNIISRAIRERLGEAEYREFPRRALFGPLGMDSARLEADAAGTFVGSSFLYATARDWAKFGQLYAQDGVWRGRRILPAGWVAYSARPTPQAPGRQYGAHFWLDPAWEERRADPEKPLPADAFHAVGYEGQYVSIVPSRSLVVVRLGLTRQASAWRQDRFVNRVIEALAAPPL